MSGLTFAPWDCHSFSGEAREVTFKFGHDFRERKLWIVERGTGRKIAELSGTLTPHELDLSARLIRSAPTFGNALFESANRLRNAQHPNAVSLRELIRDALRGLEQPLNNEVTDRIDP